MGGGSKEEDLGIIGMEKCKNFEAFLVFSILIRV
jgi:hypothetical protein